MNFAIDLWFTRSLEATAAAAASLGPGPQDPLLLFEAILWERTGEECV